MIQNCHWEKTVVIKGITICFLWWLYLTMCLFLTLHHAFSMYISHLATRNPKAETVYSRLPACLINLKNKQKCPVLFE